MANMLKLRLISVVFTVVFVIPGVSCESVVVLEHEETTLTCSISPTITSTVFWYSNSLLEYLTSDYELTAELREAAPSLFSRLSVEEPFRRGRYNLRIVDVRAVDAGDYVCGYYRNGDQWITVRTVTVEVLIPPGREFPACSALSSADTLLLPGMLVNMSCISYGGSPRADLAWYRDGVSLTSTVAHGGLWVYHQRLIQEADSGVQFTCQATSPALQEPKSCSIVPFRRAPLLYIEHEHGGVINLGNSATFTCTNQEILTPSSVGDARYRWYFNGAPAEESRSGVVTESGKSLVLHNLTSIDDRAVVSCEKVNEFSARSSASMTILVVSSAYSMLIYGERDATPSEKPATPSEKPASTALTPFVNVSRAGFVMSIFGAICFGMFFMLSLIFVARLLCNCVRKRGRLDFNTEHELAVGWQKALNNLRGHEAKRDSITIIDKSTRNTQVLTFKKPNGVVANGNLPTNDCAERLRCSNLECNLATDVDASCPVASSDRSAARLSRQGRNAISQDLLSSTSSRKKPPPLSLFNDNQRPLLSSPSPVHGSSGRRLPSVDRDYTASMPDLASRYYGERGPTTFPTDHDYVNVPALSSSKEESGNTTPSYVNCEFVTPIPPTTPVKQTRKPSFSINKKSLSYAELDLPRTRERHDTSITPLSPGGSKVRAGSLSVERTKYAQIAYVFKDRRQQSLPSVKLVGLSEGFGERV